MWRPSSHWWLLAFLCGAVRRNFASISSRVRSSLACQPKLPLRSCALVVACLEIVNASVVLSEGSDRIGIRSELLCQSWQPSISRRCGVYRQAQIRAGEAKVFVDDLRIDELQTKGCHQKLRNSVVARAVAAAWCVADDADLHDPWQYAERQFARFALQKVEVIDGMLQLTLRRPNDGG